MMQNSTAGSFGLGFDLPEHMDEHFDTTAPIKILAAQKTPPRRLGLHRRTHSDDRDSAGKSADEDDQRSLPKVASDAALSRRDKHQTTLETTHTHIACENAVQIIDAGEKPWDPVAESALLQQTKSKIRASPSVSSTSSQSPASSSTVDGSASASWGNAVASLEKSPAITSSLPAPSASLAQSYSGRSARASSASRGRRSSSKPPQEVIPDERMVGVDPEKLGRKSGSLVQKKSSQMRKVKSTPNVAGLDKVSPRELQLQAKLLQLEQEVLNIRYQLDKSTKKTQSFFYLFLRSGATLSNALLGVWVFWVRFLHFVRRHSQVRTIMWSLISRQIRGSPINPSHVIRQAIWDSFKLSSPLLVGTALLAFGRAEFRTTGAVISAIYNIILAFRYQFLPWSNYFNFFFLLLYTTFYHYSRFPTFHGLPLL